MHCSIDGCDRQVQVLRSQLCATCYSRLRKQNQTPEQRTRRLEQNRRYAASHREVEREYNRRYLQAWRLSNPEAQRVNDQRRRARKASVLVNDLTLAQWEQIIAEQSDACFYCGKVIRLTLDHKTPLSRGGNHTASNVVAACASCNSIKHDKTAEEFLLTRQL